MADHSIRIGIDSGPAEAGAKRVTRSLQEIQSAAAKALGRGGDGMAVNLDTSGIQAGAARVRRSLADIQSAAAKNGKISVTLDGSGVTAGANRITKSLRDIQSESATTVSRLDNLKGSVSALGGVMAAIGAADLGREIVSTTARFQDLETRFTTLTGSAESARETMQYLSDTSNRLSVDTFSLADSYSKLLPMIKDGTLTTAQARDMMTGLVDAQKATGASTAQLEQAMFGLAQTLGMPKANIEQLNQVTEPMPGLLGAMDRALGKLYPTAKQGAGAMREMTEEGRVTAQVFRDVTIKALQEYSGAAEKTSGNINATIQRMRNAWNQLLNTMGTQIEMPLIGALETIGTLIAALERGFLGLTRGMDGVINGAQRIQTVIGNMDLTGLLADPMGELGKAWDRAKTDNPSMPTIGPLSSFTQAPKPASSAPAQTTTAPAPLGAAEAKTTRRTTGDRYAEQKREMEEQIAAQRELANAYEYGRPGVERYQAALDDLSERQRLNSGYSKEQAEAMHGLMTELREVQKIVALKDALGSMEEAIQKARGLAEAHEEGAAAVRGVEAATNAYSTAVKLGVTNNQEAIAQLIEMEKAVQQASSALALAETMSDMDIDIAGLERTAAAYREMSGTLREATIAQEVYARSLQLGIDGDTAAVAKLRDKVVAQRAATDAAEESQRAMDRGFAIEQMEGELRLSALVGEARMIEAARLDLLIEKKHRLADATATLTAEEEKQAETMGKLSYALDGPAAGLMALSQSIPTVQHAFAQALEGGLYAFEDSLVDIVTGAKSAREAFADMARSIAQDLARMAIRMAIIQPLAAMFGGAFGGGGAMFAAGAGASMLAPKAHAGGVIGTDSLPQVRIPAFHTGGVVGSETPSMRSLPPLASWTRYHSGGMAGLASGEVPAILKRGEGVFTQGQMANLAPAGGGDTINQTFSVNVQQSQNGSPGDAERQGRIIAQQIKQAVDERLIQARRPGGINNPTGY